MIKLDRHTKNLFWVAQELSDGTVRCVDLLKAGEYLSHTWQREGDFYVRYTMEEGEEKDSFFVADTSLKDGKIRSEKAYTIAIRDRLCTDLITPEIPLYLLLTYLAQVLVYKFSNPDCTSPTALLIGERFQKSKYLNKLTNRMSRGERLLEETKGLNTLLKDGLSDTEILHTLQEKYEIQLTRHQIADARLVSKYRKV